MAVGPCSLRLLPAAHWQSDPLAKCPQGITSMPSETAIASQILVFGSAMSRYA
jgi:hypothetical protein